MISFLFYIAVIAASFARFKVDLVGTKKLTLSNGY
jgi:hypothetical protein